MKIISLINEKGGVGKTTTALALGAGLKIEGYRVLLIDLDKQGNLTKALIPDTEGDIATVKAAIADGKSAVKVLTGETAAADAIQKNRQANFIPSSRSLVSAVKYLSPLENKVYRLKKALEPLHGQYDYVIIDTPPDLNIVTVNALTASTGAIIPTHAGLFSMDGIGHIYETISEVKNRSNQNLQILGILVTCYDGRTVFGRDIVEMISDDAAKLDIKVFKSKIRRTVAVEEAQFLRQSIFEYKSSNKNAAQDYAAFVKEIIGKE